MTDGFNILAVGIEDKGPVVVFVIVRAQAWSAIVAAAGLHGCIIKGAHRVAALGRKSKMDAALDGFTTADPKLWLVASAKTGMTVAARLFRRHLENEAITQRFQNL